MFEMLKKRIDSKDYELKKMLDLIDEMRVKEKITAEETDELYEMARKNAVAENSYAPLQEQVNYLAERLIKAENEIKELKAVINKDNPIEPEEPIDEYPEFIQPGGAYNAYRIGDKITFNGKKYKCIIDYMVHTPSAYPQGWEEVVETNEEEL